MGSGRGQTMGNCVLSHRVSVAMLSRRCGGCSRVVATNVPVPSYPGKVVGGRVLSRLCTIPVPSYPGEMVGGRVLSRLCTVASKPIVLCWYCWWDYFSPAILSSLRRLVGLKSPACACDRLSVSRSRSWVPRDTQRWNFFSLPWES